MDIMLTDEDQPQADQLNSLAEGPPVNRSARVSSRRPTPFNPCIPFPKPSCLQRHVQLYTFHGTEQTTPKKAAQKKKTRTTQARSSCVHNGKAHVLASLLGPHQKNALVEKHSPHRGKGADLVQKPYGPPEDRSSNEKESKLKDWSPRLQQQAERKEKEQVAPATRPCALKKGYLTSKLARVSPKGSQT
eukprot:1156037-Pelagomonas_calceolata.AAC.3